MDDFCARLQSFYNDENEARWTLTTPSAEDMAGAGFRLQGESSRSDVAICDICQVIGWNWEAKDDPFAEHTKNGADCAYVQSPLFSKFNEMFAKKKKAITPTPPATPNAGGGRRNSSMATPRKKRAKLALSEVHTVASVEPQAVLLPKNKPMEIEFRRGFVSPDRRYRPRKATTVPVAHITCLPRSA
ncbi:hypothetical protein ACRALDRAFT_1070026 [Sodiomyces alcalophilus JCM 7366]|uniref:uncharacterized protein n=1 Tax=Sodiomyces alcalophilus JCM 7366 TaxID=591952 RepID=UPI0039B447AA